eukprot:scaffold22589_cov138-Cylindrotheca_fusiformis.AAC.53
MYNELLNEKGGGLLFSEMCPITIQAFANRLVSFGERDRLAIVSMRQRDKPGMRDRTHMIEKRNDLSNSIIRCTGWLGIHYAYPFVQPARAVPSLPARSLGIRDFVLRDSMLKTLLRLEVETNIFFAR